MSLAWRPLFDSGFARFTPIDLSTVSFHRINWNRPLFDSGVTKFTPIDLSTGSFYWIDWNLYLTDKFIPLTEQTLRAHNIGHIIAILPSEKELSDTIKNGTTPYTLLAYGDSHDEKLPIDDYERLGNMIRNMRNDRHLIKGRNVLLFCNNGFQRSLPILVYFMLHLSRPPSYQTYATVESAMNRIFKRVPFIAGGNDMKVLTECIEYLLSKPENAPPKKV